MDKHKEKRTNLLKISTSSVIPKEIQEEGRRKVGRL